MWEFIAENWAELALALITFVDVIVSMTPSKVDDRWAGYLRLLIQAMASNEKKKENGDS